MAEFHRTEEFPAVDWREACVLDREFGFVSSREATRAYAAGWSDEVREYVVRRSRAKRPVDGADENLELRRLFGELADIWRRETRGVPFLITRVTHWAYQRIMGLGPEVLPLILHELEQQSDHWYWALNAISGEDPAEGVEDFEEAAARWLEWGRATGRLT